MGFKFKKVKFFQKTSQFSCVLQFFQRSLGYDLKLQFFFKIIITLLKKCCLIIPFLE